MQAVYAGESAPNIFSKSIFLAGPTPHSGDVASWRPEALRFLEEAGYNGVVFVPENRNDAREGDLYESDYSAQVEWEDKYLNMADCILFWLPRNLATMPAFTTNTEWGVWQNSGKAVFGVPPEAEKVRYQLYYANKLEVPTADTLAGTVRLALDMLGGGALRAGSERMVPLFIWRTASFRTWYMAQRAAGNSLCDARVEWTFRVGPQRRRVFLWALHVDVFVASENRHKTNEFVIGRPDVSAVLMYKSGRDLMDTDVVLVREFRSPAASPDGFVWELPSGSAESSLEPGVVAAHEVEEETGLKINPRRLRRLPRRRGCRQIAATFSSHKASLFSVELTREELNHLLSQQGSVYGVEAETERTEVRVVKLRRILEYNFVDWSMVGMILSVLAIKNT